MGQTIGLLCSIGVGEAAGGRGVNEDDYLVAVAGRAFWREDGVDVYEDHEASGSLYAVFDGMGGARRGDVAAWTAARVLSKLYRPGPVVDPPRTLRRFVLEAHARLHARERLAGQVQAGTTITAAWLHGPVVSWVQVGDSRLYRWREGRLERFGRDQTHAEFARRDQRVVRGEARQLAQSFVFGSRGLGDDAGLRIDPGVDTGSFEVEPGDQLLLVTDGVWAWLDDATLADLLSFAQEPQEAATATVELAMERGCKDNLTALVVRIDAIDPVDTPSTFDRTAG